MVVVGVVVAAAAAAVVVVGVVVVVRGRKLAFGCFGAQTFSTLGQALVAARVYWACRPSKGSVGAACVCWACLKVGRESVCA